MSQYVCNDCCLIMQENISNLDWYYECKRCKARKMPQAAVVFSSDDHQEEGSYNVDVESIIDDKNVQQVDNKCNKCGQHYKVFFQFGNKDTRLVCECDRPVSDQIPDTIPTGRINKPTAQKKSRFYFGADLKQQSQQSLQQRTK